MTWLRLQGYAPVKIHNEGKRSAIAGAILKRQGLHPGAADIVVPLDKGRAIWFEFKSATGKLSDTQRAFERHVMSLGHRYVVARCLEDVIDAMNDDD